MVLFYYCALAAIFITVSLVLTSKTSNVAVFSLFFLPVAAYFIIEFFRRIRGKENSKNEFKIGEIIIFGIVFLILLTIGSKNIYTAKKLVQKPIPTSTPLTNPLIIPAKKTITIAINDGSTSINIRSKPTIYSEKIGEAKNGDLLEFVEKNGEWYQVRLEENRLGYVSFKYVGDVKE